MQKIFVDYLKNLEELHVEALENIRDLPQEALDWKPFPGGNSIAVIITHMAGAEKFWLGDVVAGESTGRDREAEFEVKDMEIEQLSTLLDDSLAYARTVLETLDIESLGSTRSSPRNDRNVSVGWSLGHTLKHSAIHLGHLHVTRELWEMSSES